MSVINAQKKKERKKKKKKEKAVTNLDSEIDSMEKHGRQKFNKPSC